MDLLAGLLTGLASSLHCVGVCTGVSLALMTTATRSGASPLRALVSTHGGRLLGYTMAGALVGLGGGVLGGLFSMAGLNHLLRWVAAAVLVWTGLSVAGLAPAPRVIDRWLPSTPGGVARARRGPLNPLLMGLAWSLMPCGMVYLALLNASFTGNPLRGASYMAAFAVGTLPALGLVSWGGAGLAKKFQGQSEGRPQARLRAALGWGLVALAPLSIWFATPNLFGICRGQ